MSQQKEPVLFDKIMLKEPVLFQTGVANGQLISRRWVGLDGLVSDLMRNCVLVLRRDPPGHLLTDNLGQDFLIYPSVWNGIHYFMTGLHLLSTKCSADNGCYLNQMVEAD